MSYRNTEQLVGCTGTGVPVVSISDVTPSHEDTSGKKHGIWSKRNIAANALALASGEVFCRVLSLVLVVTVARLLGPDQMGIYAFCIALYGNLLLVINFGFDTYISRETAREPEGSMELFGKILGAKFALYLFVVPLAVLIAALSMPPHKFRLVAVMLVTLTGAITASTIYAFCKAQLKGHMQSIGLLLTRLIAGGGGLALVLGGAGIMGVAIGEFAATITIALAAWFMTRKVLGFKPVVRVDFRNLALFKKTWKFGIYQILVNLSASAGLIILPLLSTDRATGYFSAAEKIGTIITFIPAAIAGTMLPVFSRLSTGDPERYNLWMGRYFAFQMLAGALACSLLAGSSTFLPDLIFGASFSAVGKVVELLSPLAICVFVNPALSIALITKNQEGRMLAVFSFTALVNCLLCVVLIPAMAERGAAIASLASNVLLLIIQFFSIPPSTRVALASFKSSAVPLAAAAVCIGVWKYIEHLGFHSGIGAASGVTLFLMVVLITGSVTIKDFKSIVTMLRKR